MGSPATPACFNPLPTRRPGGTCSGPSWSSNNSGFNPLPTRRPGGTVRRRGQLPAVAVSIRSRPEGREERVVSSVRFRCASFQSAPDPKAGRNHVSGDRRRGRRRFNPLPTRRPGGTPASRPSGRRNSCFNPLPTRRPGGTSRPRTHRGPRCGFNPLPTRRPGGTVNCEKSRWGMFVSIRSRPEGREEQRNTYSGVVDLKRFNPLPTRRPGGTRSTPEPTPRARRVSIRSRPEGREEQGRQDRIEVEHQFQSAPDPKAGRNRSAAPVGSSSCPFQSAPDPKAGRNTASKSPSRPLECFNPLPTRRPGGTRRRSFMHPCYARFNPLPTRRPGGTIATREAAEKQESFNPLPTRRPGGTTPEVDAQLQALVSIRSRPEGREELKRKDISATELRFQSAPDPKAGRNPARRRPRPQRQAVSIRSRPEGREERVYRATRGPNGFQSAPDPKAGRN